MRKQKAFTLVELLIVIGIIAILTVAFLPTLRGGQAKARDSARQTLLTNLVVAFEKDVNENAGNGLPAEAAPVAPNVVAGQGVCVLSFVGSPGPAISSLLGRNPEVVTYPAIGGGGGGTLCNGQGIYFNRMTANANNFVLGIQVENAGNANVEAGVNVATLTGWDTKAAVLAGTDAAVGAGDAGRFYYVLVKE